MDKLGADELRRRMKLLMQAAKCAVCLNVLQLDTIMCVNGHVICRSCQRTQTCCPTCRKGFSNLENSTFIRQVLEIIPHTCPNNGCPALVYEGNDHEKYCNYRPIQCKFAGCTWQGCVKYLRQHCELVHSLRSNVNCFAPLKTTLNEFTLKDDKNYANCFQTLGQLFFERVEYKACTGMMTFTVHPILSERFKNNLFLHVKFDSGKKYCSFTEKIEHNPEENSVGENTIYVPLMVLYQFLDEKNKTLTYATYVSFSS